MAQFSDFSSFFEIGIGLGIALSLFRIPIDNRKSALITKIDNELKLFSHQGSPEAMERYEKAGEIAITLDGAIQSLESRAKHNATVALLGALMNIVLLFIVALNPDDPATTRHIFLFGFVAFGWYICLSVTILWLIDRYLGPIERQLIFRNRV